MDAISYSYADKQAKRIKKFINDPDSTSGIVTVPKVIASGENITVPAGRVAVLPNVQIDGTLNVQGDVFIPSGATLSKVVELDGDQTIAGVKTFSSSPIVPTPTTGTQAVNLATANSYDLGVGQTWQNVTTSRSLGVTYTNNTGKSICVAVSAGTITAPGYITAAVDGVNVILGGMIFSSAAIFTNTSFIVPNGSTYRVSISEGNLTLNLWTELR